MKFSEFADLLLVAARSEVEQPHLDYIVLGNVLDKYDLPINEDNWPVNVLYTLNDRKFISAYPRWNNDLPRECRFALTLAGFQEAERLRDGGVVPGPRGRG